MGIYIDFSTEYENLAQSWANHLDRPFDAHGRECQMCMGLIEALWTVYPEVIEYIEVDPTAFAQRVSEYRSHMHQSPKNEV